MTTERITLDQHKILFRRSKRGDHVVIDTPEGARICVLHAGQIPEWLPPAVRAHASRLPPAAEPAEPERDLQVVIAISGIPYSISREGTQAIRVQEVGAYPARVYADRVEPAHARLPDYVIRMARALLAPPNAYRAALEKGLRAAAVRKEPLPVEWFREWLEGRGASIGWHREVLRSYSPSGPAYDPGSVQVVIDGTDFVNAPQGTTYPRNNIEPLTWDTLRARGWRLQLQTGGVLRVVIYNTLALTYAVTEKGCTQRSDGKPRLYVGHPARVAAERLLQTIREVGAQV